MGIRDSYVITLLIAGVVLSVAFFGVVMVVRALNLNEGFILLGFVGLLLTPLIGTYISDQIARLFKKRSRKVESQ